VFESLGEIFEGGAGFAVKANLRGVLLTEQPAFHGIRAFPVAAGKWHPARQAGTKSNAALQAGPAKTTDGPTDLLRCLMMSFDKPQPLVDAASYLGEQVGRHGVFQFVGFGNRVARFISKRRQRMSHRVDVSGTIANA
jgi:hypothetical protein